jgi:hypothetical protein
MAFKELGVSGLNRWGGYIFEEFIRELQGNRGSRKFREMRLNDGIVSGAISAIVALQSTVPSQVEPFDDSKASQDNKEFLEQCMEDMNRSWEEFRAEVMDDMLTYGFCPTEVVYKHRRGQKVKTRPRIVPVGTVVPSQDVPSSPVTTSKHDDNKIGWRKVATRAPEYIDHWVFDDAGGIQGYVQIAPPDYQYRTIPIEKALLFRTTTARGNPEGRSLLRSAYIAWHMKKNLREIQGIGAERDLTGLPKLQYPAKLDLMTSSDSKAVTQRAEAKKILQAVRFDTAAGALIPDDWDFDLIASPGQKSVNTTEIINSLNVEMLVAMLMDFLITGHEKVGSFALNVSKIDIAISVIGAYVSMFHEVMNMHGIPRLFALNGITDNLPRLTSGKVLAADMGKLEKMGDILSKLGALGWEVFPDPEMDSHFRELLGLPARSEALPTIEEEIEKKQKREDVMAKLGEKGLAKLEKGGTGELEDDDDDDTDDDDKPLDKVRSQNTPVDNELKKDAAKETGASDEDVKDKKDKDKDK